MWAAAVFVAVLWAARVGVVEGVEYEAWETEPPDLSVPFEDEGAADAGDSANVNMQVDVQLPPRSPRKDPFEEFELERIRKEEEEEAKKPVKSPHPVELPNAETDTPEIFFKKMVAQMKNRIDPNADSCGAYTDDEVAAAKAKEINRLHGIIKNSAQKTFGKGNSGIFMSPEYEKDARTGEIKGLGRSSTLNPVEYPQDRRDPAVDDDPDLVFDSDEV
jgi:hypothetical protein